jgi:vancomycin resistance protein YoaR
MSSLTYTHKNSDSIFEKLLIAVFAGLLISLAVFTIFGISIQIKYANHIFPGVSIAGQDLGGLSPQEASISLQQALVYPEQGKVLMRDGETTYLLSPNQLGLFFDPETTIAQAMKIGRDGGITKRITAQWNAWRYGRRIAPVFVLDKRIAVSQINQLASQVNVPVIEADLTVEGVDVVVHSGQVGRHIDVDATLAKVSALLPTLQDGIIDLEIEETAPIIVNAEEQAQYARRILSHSLKLTADNASGSPWEFTPNDLTNMLRIERIQDDAGGHFQVVLGTDYLTSFLYQLSAEVSITPQNARYIFNDDTRELEVIENAVIGRTLNVEATIEKIQSKILEEGEHEIALVFDEQEPELTDDLKGADVGVTELIHDEYSYFYGSSADRVQNIKVAASKFHGLMIAPGATFSMADALGDISLDNGYAEALIIAGGQTITGVGGGVCQVSTTLFRTVFFAGFPIVERYSHAYRVSYYERVAGGGIDASLAGLDATVYVPVVDFKFVNDSPYWILMETYVNPTYSSIQWKFYSTNDGRTVDWDTSGPTNKVEAPDPKYVENPDLSEGEIKQVDWAAEGADVTVNRRVNRDGSLLFEDTFFTHYQPWQAVYEYGPGTEIPTPEP